MGAEEIRAGSGHAVDQEKLGAIAGLEVEGEGRDLFVEEPKSGSFERGDIGGDRQGGVAGGDGATFGGDGAAGESAVGLGGVDATNGGHDAPE